MHWQVLSKSHYKEIDEQDAALMQKFMNPEKRQASLSDLILAKMSASQEIQAPVEEQALNPKVVQVYTK